MEETEGTQRGALEKNSDVAHETRDRPEDIIEEQSSDTIEQQNNITQEQRSETLVDPVISDSDTYPSEGVLSESTAEINTEACEELETENSVSSQTQEEPSRNNSVTKSGNFWKPGSRFSGVDEVTGECVSGKIISRAGKPRGRNKNCYDIQRDNG